MQKAVNAAVRTANAVTVVKTANAPAAERSVSVHPVKTENVQKAVNAAAKTVSVATVAKTANAPAAERSVSVHPVKMENVQKAVNAAAKTVNAVINNKKTCSMNIEQVFFCFNMSENRQYVSEFKHYFRLYFSIL
mgnify:CR=1 FL=1